MNIVFTRVMGDVKVSKPSEIDKTALSKLRTKEPLMDIIISLVNVFEDNVRTCRSAAEKN